MLTIVVMIAGFIAALIVNAGVQTRSLLRADGVVRSAVKAGLLSVLTMVGVVAAYLAIGNLWLAVSQTPDF